MKDCRETTERAASSGERTSATWGWRRSFACCRRNSARLGAAVSGGAITGRGTGESSDAEVKFGQKALETAADGPVQQTFIGAAASFLDRGRGAKHDCPEEGNA